MGTETIYVDSFNHCHRNDDGMMTAVETEFFIGKCDTVVEGYCCKITENGNYIYPWKPYDQLDTAQRAYERQLIAEYEVALSEIETALGVTG